MIRLFDLPHKEMAPHLNGPVWLLANPVEYHGPHLSLHNDRFLSLGMAQDVCKLAGWPCVMTEDLEVGVGPAPGPGSRYTTYQTMKTLVAEACERLADLGAKQVILLTFHGDPIHNLALQTGIEALAKRGVRAVAPFNRLLREMLTLQPAQFARALAHIPEPHRSDMLRDLKFDFHAGFFETSLSLYYAPDTVSPAYKTLPPCPPVRQARVPAFMSHAARRLGAAILAEEFRFAAQGMGWHAIHPFPGYTSAPHFATREAGEIFATEIRARFKEEIEGALLQGKPSPKPIMGWLEMLN